MTDIRATLRARLDAAVGSAQVLTAESDVLPYVTDWRGRFHGRALAVVRPGSTDEVAAVVRACAELRVPIVAQGGNTGQCGGATPDAQGNAIVLSLARMNRVRAVDPDNATLTAEAGVPLAAVQQAAERQRAALSAVARGRRELHDRRQSLDQRRRDRGASLRQRARARARASKSCWPTAASGTVCADCARTIPATISSSSSSAPRARWAS